MEETVEFILTGPVVQSIELCSFCEYYLWIIYLERVPHEVVGVPTGIRYVILGNWLSYLIYNDLNE